MPRGVGYGAKHRGHGVSRQFGDSHGNGRQRSGGKVSPGKQAMTSMDASTGQQRYAGSGIIRNSPSDGYGSPYKKK